MTKPKDTKAITIQFPNELGKQLLVAEITEERSRHEIVAEAVREHFERGEPNKQATEA